MRISFSSTIMHPPRDWNVSLKKRRIDMQIIMEGLGDFKEIDELRRDMSFDDFLYRVRNGRNFSADFIYNVKHNKYQLESLYGNLVHFHQYGTGTWFDYLVQSADALLNAEFSEPPEIDLDKVSEMVEETKHYNPQDLPIIKMYKDFAQKMLDMDMAIKRLKVFAGQVMALNKQKVDAHKANWGEKPQPPKGIQTLYHATMNMSYLLKNGFSENRPNHRGVGSYGQDNLISLTYDLNVAREIARAMKEMWMIVHGKMSENSVLRLLQESGVDYKSCNNEETGVKRLLNLYNCWLWKNDSKIRKNPVFAHVSDLDEVLKTVKLSDIGILKIDADLEGSEHFTAESEYRVKPGMIKRVQKL